MKKNERKREDEREREKEKEEGEKKKRRKERKCNIRRGGKPKRIFSRHRKKTNIHQC